MREEKRITDRKKTLNLINKTRDSDEKLYGKKQNPLKQRRKGKNGMFRLSISKLAINLKLTKFVDFVNTHNSDNISFWSHKWLEMYFMLFHNYKA